jgi:hypothetical protein
MTVEPRDEAADALASFTRSASAPWGGATLHVGYRSVAGPDDTYWAARIEDGRLAFAVYLGTVGDFSHNELMGGISLRREDLVIVDDEVALVTEEEEHARGGVRSIVVVLTRDGVVRGRFPGVLDPAEPPRRVGDALRLRRRPDPWNPDPVVYVQLAQKVAPMDAVAAAAQAHGYAHFFPQPLALDGRCRARLAAEAASGRPVLLVGFPPMREAERDAVFLAWGERPGESLPGVLAVHGWIAWGDPACPVVVVLDAPPGRPLTAWVDKGRPLPAREQQAVVDAVSHALERAHARGRVHGWLWRDRIWIEDGAVRLMDVGLERALATAVTTDPDPERTDVVGTPWAWAAPEVLRGEADDPRSDVWSFALLVFWMRTGVDYWIPGRSRESVGELAARILTGPLLTASKRARTQGRTDREVPSHEFDEWFRLCVARDPRERFASLADARAALPW